MDSLDPRMLAYMLRQQPPSIERQVSQRSGDLTAGLGLQGQLPNLGYNSMPMSTNVDDRRFSGKPSWLQPYQDKFARGTPVPVPPDSAPPRPYEPDPNLRPMALDAGYSDIGLQKYLQGLK